MRGDWLNQFLPVLGVVVGWLLNEISARLRTRGETRRRLGEAVGTLLWLRHELRILLVTWEFHKDDKPGLMPHSFEASRKRAIQRMPHFHPEALNDQRLQEAIRVASGINPVLGSRLEGNLAMLKVLQRTDLKAFSRDADAYIRTLSALEVGHLLNIKELTSITARLAFHMGFLTWASVVWEMRNLDRSTKKTAGTASEFSRGLFGEFLSKVAAAENGEATEKAAGPGPGPASPSPPASG